MKGAWFDGHGSLRVGGISGSGSESLAVRFEKRRDGFRWGSGERERRVVERSG